MGVALGGADRHPGGSGDLLEREPEGILEDEDACLRGGERGETVAKIGPELGELGLALGRGACSCASVFFEGIVAAGAAAQRDVTTRIQCQPMEPGGERRLAPELAELDAELGQRLLRGIARILGVTEHVSRETADAGSVALTQRLQGSGISVLRAPHKDGVAESVIGELGLRPQRSADSTS